MQGWAGSTGNLEPLLPAAPQTAFPSLLSPGLQTAPSYLQTHLVHTAISLGTLYFCLL